MSVGGFQFRINLSEQRSMGLVASWLIIVNIFALLALNRLNLTPDTALNWMSPDTFKPVQTWNIIDLHNRWDSYWYLHIATNGYQYWGDKNQSNVVFFPVYPILVAALKPFCGGNPVLAGWIVSSLFLALSAILLTRLTQEFHPDISDPLLPTTFMLVYPTAFYLNAVYSESVFLFFSLAAVLSTLRKNFAMAGLWIALASATRVAGLFLCIFLLTEFIQEYGFRSLFSWRAWPLAVAPMGAIVFFTYHWVEFGDFFLYFSVQKTFGRSFNPDSRFFDIHTNPHLVHTILEIFFTVVTIALGIIALVRLKISYGLYMLTSLGIAMSSGTTLGISRYSMVMFPIYLIAGTIRSSVGRMVWGVGSTLLLALNIVSFVNHYWAG
jgi:Gpi18-like mannosyltransferase